MKQERALGAEGVSEGWNFRRSPDHTQEEPLRTAQILDLYSYNRWANDRVLSSCAPLSAAEWSRDLGGSFGSVGQTMAHLAAAEWIWLERWTGRSPSSLMGELALDTLSQVETVLADVEARRDAFLQGLDEVTATAELAYTNTKGTPFRAPLWRLLRHVVNHGTYHRGQVANYLRMLGREPLSTDMIVFDREG